MKTAVLLVTFNRLDYLKEVLAAVSKAKPPRLYIASDGPRPEKDGEKEKVQEVRDYLLSHIDWDCEVKTRFLEVNSGGCGKGVSGAVTWFFENEPEGIILEDDCVPDLTFFSFCEELLDKYRNDKRVWHIAGDAPIEADDIKESYYFAKIQHCWGWASWADRWKHFTYDISHYGEDVIKKFSDDKYVQKYWKKIQEHMNRKEIDTWDYQWTFNIVANGGLCINPTHCLVSNIGDIGIHYSKGGTELHRQIVAVKTIKHPKSIKLNEACVDLIYQKRYCIDTLTAKRQRAKLSIITVCRNIKDEIGRTCESIVNQTWQDFEWIVVDGGSTDGTIDILKKYADRIDILISESDTGIYNAMNKGIEVARHEWLNFMNGGDCFAANDVLEKVFKDKEYDANVLYGNMLFHRKNQTVCKVCYPSVLRKSFFYDKCINHQSAFFRSDVFKKYGVFDENFKISADVEYWIRLLDSRVSFQHLDQYVARFYEGGISNNSQYTSQQVKEKNKIFVKYNVKQERNVQTFKLFGFLPLLKIEEV